MIGVSYSDGISDVVTRYVNVRYVFQGIYGGRKILLFLSEHLDILTASVFCKVFVQLYFCFIGESR
jgi:hypothetical protein